MGFLQNAWVIGIGGGIVSGLIVYFLTTWIVSKQSKRELLRRVSMANQEVVLAVRHGVPENRVPTEHVLRAMIEATARKHTVTTGDLYGPSEVAQDLIKDVMDSSFIPAETKEAYTNRLSKLISPPASDTPKAALRPTISSSGQAAVLSAGLASMAAITSLALVLIEDRAALSTPTDTLSVGIWAPLITALAAVLVTGLAGFYVNIRNRASVREARDLARRYEKELDASPMIVRWRGSGGPRP